MPDPAAASPWQPFLIAIATAAAVVAIQRLFLSKKETHDVRAQQAATSREMLKDRQKSFREFETALRGLKAVRDQENASVVEPKYWDVRTAANVYMDQIELIASFVRRGDIDTISAEQDHFDELRKAAFKAIPAYYGFIEELADEFGFPKTEHLDEDSFINLRLLMSEKLGHEEYEEMKRLWNMTGDTAAGQS